MNPQEQAVLSAEELLLPGTTVAVIGNISRTWYIDRAILAEVVLWLLEAGAKLRIMGKLPFDALVEIAAEEEGYGVECTGPLDAAERLRQRDRDGDEVLQDIGFVVAFPREGCDVLSADPIIEIALLNGLSVLAVYRTKWVWFTAGNYVYA